MALKRVEQISENHCGPAVLQMLLQNVGIEASQQEITKAAGAEKTIMEHGTRVDQLALACFTLAPRATFWYKEKSSLDDLRVVLNEHDYPVGVEWQGLFEDSLEDEEEEGIYGHYSIISHIDDSKGQVVIVDPYKPFANQDRIVAIDLFDRRWWDWNEMVYPGSEKGKYRKDIRLFFIVTLKNTDFPEKLGMKTFTFE